LQKEGKEVKLAAICLPNGKARNVFEGIANVLDEYNLWKSIKIFLISMMANLTFTKKNFN